MGTRQPIPCSLDQLPTRQTIPWSLKQLPTRQTCSQSHCCWCTAPIISGSNDSGVLMIMVLQVVIMVLQVVIPVLMTMTRRPRRRQGTEQGTDTYNTDVTVEGTLTVQEQTAEAEEEESSMSWVGGLLALVCLMCCMYGAYKFCCSEK